MICSVQKYRLITKDATSLDDDIKDALAGAEAIVERRTGRRFALRDSEGVLIERTERLKVYQDGRVYPKATPVVSVYEPTGTYTDGTAVLGKPGAFEEPGPLWTRAGFLPYVTIRYSGGYEATEMPYDIVQAVAEIAGALLETEQASSEIPPGVKSVHVGDVSLTMESATSASSIVPAHIEAILRAWRKRDV